MYIVCILKTSYNQNMKKNLFILLFLLSQVMIYASDLSDIWFINDSIVVLYFDDGYVDHYTLNQTKEDDVIHSDPLNLLNAMTASSYDITSEGDPAYQLVLKPDSVGRKSRGNDFSGRTAEGNPVVMEHHIYLFLPHPFVNGQEYTISWTDLNSITQDTTFTWNYKRSRSESIHVNQLGYAPEAPAKLAYISHWMGDKGPMESSTLSGFQFKVIRTADEVDVFSGTIMKRKDLQTGGVDGSGEKDTPYGSFSGADVWVCDFSAFTEPGEYRVTVEGMGCSFPFRIEADIYRQPYIETARALYHQRCGTALMKAYTEWTRDRCHHPDENPEVELSDWRYMDKRNAFSELPANATGQHRPWYGGWHDAADWDRRTEHLTGIRSLLLAYELRPFNFKDGELNIPESGNGIPDILDEAKWGVDLFSRMQEEEGGIHGGIETTGHPEAGVASAQDHDQWYAYAVDPVVTFSYAGTAAQLALCWQMTGQDSLANLYLLSAQKAYQYGMENTPAGEVGLTSVKENRHYASAALFRATGEEIYQEQFITDNVVTTPTRSLYNYLWGTWMMALDDRTEPALRQTLSDAAIHWARFNHTDFADKRGYRYGSQWSWGTGWGNATTPDVLLLFVAHRLSGNPEFLSYAYTSCDYTLGANPLNMCWVTGQGDRSPVEVMHLDSRYYHKETGILPGLVPFGPSVYANDPDPGFWEEGYAQNLVYPDGSLWPSHELYSESRYIAKTNEFTIHSSIIPSAVAYGLLSEPDYEDLSLLAIQGPAVTGLFEEHLGYSVDSIPGATYKWTLPATATSEGSDTQRRIEVTWGCRSDTISVDVTTSDTTWTISKTVRIKPYQISGPGWIPDTLDTYTYRVNGEGSYDYNWSADEGMVLLSGQLSNEAVFSISQEGCIYVDLVTSCETITDSLCIQFGDGQFAYPDSVPHHVPGTIRTAYYDFGGEGVAYHDADPVNNGPGIRPEEGVDTETKEESETVGWVQTGEWLEYSAYIEKDSLYNFKIRTGGEGDGGLFNISFNNSLLADNIPAIHTGSWAIYEDVRIDSLFLEKDTGVLRIDIVQGGFNIGDMQISFFESSTTPIDTTGLPAIEYQGLQIYPVPATTHLWIRNADRLSPGTRYDISDLAGRVWEQGRVRSGTPIEINGLPEGMYVFRLKAEGFPAIHCLLIKKEEK